jgi:hypothetical protein
LYNWIISTLKGVLETTDYVYFAIFVAQFSGSLLLLYHHPIDELFFQYSIKFNTNFGVLFGVRTHWGNSLMLLNCFKRILEHKTGMCRNDFVVFKPRSPSQNAISCQLEEDENPAIDQSQDK